MPTTAHPDVELEEEQCLDSGSSVVQSPMVRRWAYCIAKRAIDLTVSVFGLVILSPLFLVVGLLIKLTSSGPVFYAWDVVGFRGRPFRGYKFRTMVSDADVLKMQLLHQNEMNGPVFKITDDPRITPLGRILRKYSIDELPQLWSVLKGDMSLVGPRPAGPHEWEKYEPWQCRKLSVTPGMTCLWQVSGRNQIKDFDEWVKLDLEYIDHWSLWLDLKTLLRTVVAVLQGTGV
jgi:lipopolysaccharide/colanic/teichoic acid biosynthesis glycosyltransferase